MVSKKTFETALDFFPYGTQYHRAPTPLPEEWDTDFREIKKAGYTHVQFRPQWRWHERIRNRATWEGLDRLFDLAHHHGLKVVLKPMLETAPDWVYEDLKGHRIGCHGVPITPFAHGAYYVGGWWPCFDNPGVVEAAADFVRRMVQRYHKHPALWFYDAWNEPVSRPVSQCQCPHSVASYRNWLRERYGTIEELNAFFGKAWTSYETLQPPVVADDYVELFLWRQWAGHSVSQQVKFVADAIRAVDPNAFVMVHIGQSCVVQDPVCATSDDLLNARMTDRYGTSFWIPLHPKTPTDHAHADYQSDWLRRIDPSYWCHEFYTNHADWCRPPEPVTLNRLIWMAVAGGAAGFTFWQYRSERLGNETNGYGMRNIDGSPTPRSEVTDGIGQILKIFGNRLIGTRREPSPVALLYSRQSDLIMRIQETKAGWTETLARENGTSDYSYKQALKNAHAMYLANGQTCEWVTPGDDLSNVQLLHVTCAEMIDAPTAEWLKNFVRHGGRLVVELPFACRDERTWVATKIPMHGLDELLGCTEANRIVTRPDVSDIATFTNGCRARARRWRIDLAATTATPFAQWPDGSSAAVKNTFGKGTVFTLAFNPAFAFTDRWDDPALSVYDWLLCSASIPAGPEADPNVWIRQRRGPDYEIWFVFNVSEKIAKVTLPATPNQVWQDTGCRRSNLTLELPPGHTWIAELPLL